MSTRKFSVTLQRPPGSGTWTYLAIPFDAARIYGSRGQIKVRGTLNRAPFRGVLLPRGDGTHYMVVNRALRQEGRAEAGDRVKVEIALDTAPRVVEPPPDLMAALENEPAAGEVFARLAPSHRKAYIEYIEEARRPETRKRRVEITVVRLKEGKRPKA